MEKDTNKRDLGLPDIPDKPKSLSSFKGFEIDKKLLPSLESEKDFLPELPDSNDSGNENTEITGAIDDIDFSKDLPKIPGADDLEDYDNTTSFPFKSESKTMEMEEWNSNKKEENLPMGDTSGWASLKSPKQRSVFVKLSKFQEAKKSLEIVKQKLTDIDELLETIKNVKKDEENELIGWEKEIETIKSRINLISNEIFDNAEGAD